MKKYSYSLTALRAYSLTILRSFNLTILRSSDLPIFRSYSLSLLLCSFALLLFACDQDVDIPAGKPDEFVLPPESEKIVVNFSVSEPGFGDNVVVTPRSVSADYEKTVAIPLTEDTYMYATLTEEQAPIRLRAAKVSLTPGTKVRIAAYITLANDTVFSGDYADYEVSSDGIHLTTTSPLTVYPGLPYKFAAYSYNNAAAMPAFSDTTPVPNVDLLWGDTLATIDHQSQPPFHLHITMQHKRSKVVIDATAAANLDGINNILNSVDASLYCYDNPVLNVKTGALNPSNGLTWSPFSWTITNPLLPAALTSDTLYVLTGEEATTHLRINQMRINYLTFNDPLDIIYDKPLEGGKSYILKVHFMWARGGSADRITWDDLNGKYAITRDPTDAGLYFKFGSVVGIYSDDGSILTLPGQTSPIGFYANDVAWHPFSVSIVGWSGVPAYAPGDYPKKITPDDDYHTVANVMAGKGDPCRLVGLNLTVIRDKSIANTLTYADIDNGIWRLPTLQENIWFTDSAKYSSSFFWNSGSSPFGPGVAGGEFPQQGNALIFSEGRKSRFLPAAGCREYNLGDAIVVSQGLIGYYWSNEPVDDGLIIGGNLLTFNPFGIAPTPPFLPPNSENPNWGFSVRCVRQTLNFEVSAEPWEDGGNLNVGNEGNVKL